MKTRIFLTACLLGFATLALNAATELKDNLQRDIVIKDISTKKDHPNQSLWVNGDCFIPSCDEKNIDQTCMPIIKRNVYYCEQRKHDKVIKQVLYDVTGAMLHTFDTPVYVRFTEDGAVAKLQKDTFKMEQFLFEPIDTYNGRQCMKRYREEMNSSPKTAIEYLQIARALNYPEATENELGKAYFEWSKKYNDTQLDYYNCLDRAARNGHVEAMVKLGEKYTAKARAIKNNQLLKAGKDWYRLAADKGHPQAAYALGVMYETGTDSIFKDPKQCNPMRWGKAKAYYEAALPDPLEYIATGGTGSNSYQTLAETAIQNFEKKLVPVQVKGHLPSELVEEMDYLKAGDVLVLAKKGYLEAIETYCQKTLFFYYGDVFQPSDIQPFDDGVAVSVIPFLKGAAPQSPVCELMLAMVLSDMRFFDRVFDVDHASSFTDLKEAQRLLWSYRQHPVQFSKLDANPLGLNDEQVNVGIENIMGYDANVELPKPSAYSGIKFFTIPIPETLPIMQKPASTTTTSSGSSSGSSTSSGKGKLNSSLKGDITMEQMFYYPMGFTFMPKNGTGIMEFSQYDKAVNLLKKNISIKYTTSTSDDRKNKYVFFYDEYPYTYNGYALQGDYGVDKESRWSSWWYFIKIPSKNDAIALAKKMTKDLKDLGYPLIEENRKDYDYYATLTSGNYYISVDAEYDKYSKSYKIRFFIYPNHK